MALVSCDDKELESNKVSFSGLIRKSDFTPAPNMPFRILVRDNPNVDLDTTIDVRITGVTDANGVYDITVASDGFPTVPFYAVVPTTDTLIALQFNGCLGRVAFTQVSPKDNVTDVQFGIATFLKIVCNKVDESANHTMRIMDCSADIHTTLSKPDQTFYIKLPFEYTPSPYTFFYAILNPDFSSETKDAQAWLQAYDTTEVVINY